jgi:hypothetical protein
LPDGVVILFWLHSQPPYRDSHSPLSSCLFFFSTTPEWQYPDLIIVSHFQHHIIVLTVLFPNSGFFVVRQRRCKLALIR